MRTYTVTTAARMLDISNPELVDLVHKGIADAVTLDGHLVRPFDLNEEEDLVPEWVIAELAASPEYLEDALGGLALRSAAHRLGGSRSLRA